LKRFRPDSLQSCKTGVSKIKEGSVDRIMYSFEFHNKNGCCEIPSKAPLTLPKGRNRRGEAIASNVPPLGEVRRGLVDV